MKTIRLLFLITIHLLSVNGSLSAQNITINNASLAVTTTPPVLQFNYTEVDDFLAPIELINAIHLNVMLRQQAGNVSAMLTYTSAPGTPAPDWVSTKLFSQVGSNAPVNTNYIVLPPNVSVPLFTQPAHVPTDYNYHYYTFNFNLKLNPRTTFVTQGTYNFTITYTMTAQ